MKKYTLAAILTACMIAYAPFASPSVRAEGDDYSQTLSTVQVKKYLVLQTGVTVPNVTFRYTLTPGQKIEKTDSTHEVLPGPDGAEFIWSENRVGTTASVTFTPEDVRKAESSAPDGSTIPFATDDSSDEVYAEKTLTIDLSRVSFPSAGIYRYVLTEQGSGMTGLSSTDTRTRYLDVFVHKSDSPEDNTDENMDQDRFVPGSVIVRMNNSAPDTEGKAGTSVKSTGFADRFATNSLDFSKDVTGNQASFNQYFKFTVKLTGNTSAENGGTRVMVNGSFDPQPGESMATAYDADVMAAANDGKITSDGDEGIKYVTLSQLMEGKDFYIKGGQSVRLTGIPAGMGYEVTEDAEDYTPSAEVTGDDECTVADDSVTDDSLTRDTSLAFLNTRDGILPSTGIAAAFALPVAALLTGIAGITLLTVKRIRRIRQKTYEGNDSE